MGGTAAAEVVNKMYGDDVRVFVIQVRIQEGLPRFDSVKTMARRS